jgi:hypothetical protein
VTREKEDACMSYEEEHACHRVCDASTLLQDYQTLSRCAVERDTQREKEREFNRSNFPQELIQGCIVLCADNDDGMRRGNVPVHVHVTVHMRCHVPGRVHM